MTLALSCKVLGIYLYKIKFKIACSLNDIQIPTKALYDHTWQNLPHMSLALYWVWSRTMIPIERCFMLLRPKLMYTPQITSYSYTGNTLKHASITYILHTLKYDLPSIFLVKETERLCKSIKKSKKKERMGHMKVPKHWKKWWAHEGS